MRLSHLAPHLAPLLLLVAVACGTPKEEPPPKLVPPPRELAGAPAVASVAELVKQPTGDYVVVAYAVAVIGGCPACKGPDPCAPCPASGFHLVDEPSFDPADAGPTAPWVFPAGYSVDAIQSGKRYRFTLHLEAAKDGGVHLDFRGVEDLPKTAWAG